MHYDSGFIKCVSPTTAEWILAHNSSNAEVLRGEVSVAPQPHAPKQQRYRAVFLSTSVPNATEVESTKREYMVVGGVGATTLEETFYMSTKSVPGPEATPHLRALYHRGA